MSSFIVSGGKPLSGTLTVGGSKNAVLPIIFSTLTCHGVSVIKNVPDITDVDDAIALISAFGARVKRDGTTLTVDTASLEYASPDETLTERIRASTYLMGACLARFGEVSLSRFGGCNFENRPIDLHIYAFKTMGAMAASDRLVMKKSEDSDIFLAKPSVGATANTLILSASIPRTTRIFGYAKEPHITVLSDFLRSAGAKIELGSDFIEVEGRELSGGEIDIPGDRIEAGTFSLLSLITGGEVSVRGVAPHELSRLTEPLLHAGAAVRTENNSITVSGSLTKPVSFVAEPYPGLPTDLQPVIAPVLGVFRGGGLTDRVFPSRFGYLNQLAAFGLRAEFNDGSAWVFPSRLTPARVSVPDLRAGAALLLTALKVDGESRIDRADIIKRGYGDVIKKLSSIGAQIYEI